MTTNADKRREAIRATATELQRPGRWRRDDPRGRGAAFDVRLLSATTMSGEFEIITRAIYAAAADRPRPARPTPVTNDKTDRRGGQPDRKLTLRPPT